MRIAKNLPSCKNYFNKNQIYFNKFIPNKYLDIKYFSDSQKSEDVKISGDQKPETSNLSIDQIKIEQLEKDLKEMKDKVLRSLAEEENVRRIAKRDVENAKAYANSSFAKSLLDVADNLDLALVAAKTDKPKNSIDSMDNRTSVKDSDLLKNLIEGVEATNKGLLKAFSQFGIIKVIYLNIIISYILFIFFNHCLLL